MGEFPTKEGERALQKTIGFCNSHLLKMEKRRSQAFPQTLRLLQGGKGNRVPPAEHLWIEVSRGQRLYLPKTDRFFGMSDPSPTNLCHYRSSVKTVCNTSSVMQ